MSIVSSVVPGALLISFAGAVQVFVFPLAQGPGNYLLGIAGLIIQL
ncbi:hypothetical protein [Pseudomonas japonica]|nr:hypothetical protein [Pseudomonas japonica]MBA1244684.1 hypothetical protein [Pseudomonas japonica]MBA1290201.1 hypothetical protein [Pseudomonas japonica]